MTLYFAYGANMERAAMGKRCPGAQPLGPALLRGWRYVIAQGYGSVAPAPGMRVFGVLWRLTPRDLAALNAFESLDSGLYRRAMLTVEIGGPRVRALVYVGEQRGRRRPMPGYQERVVAAAEDWKLPIALCCGACAPCARLSRGASGRDRRDRMIVRRAVVHGRVQGVGFRAFVEDTAERLGLEGWVRNRRDGTVEAVFAGPEQSVTAALEACRAGPRHGHVDRIEVADAGSDLLSQRRPGERFSVLATT